MTDASRSYVLALLLLLASVAAIGVRTTFWGGPLETHEAFVAQTAREMLASGDPVVPTFGGEVRLKKPPLMYWLASGIGALSGGGDVEVWMARLPSALSLLVLVGVTVAIGGLTFGRATGLLGGAMAGLSSGGVAYGGSARPEMLYAACSAVMLLGFLKAWRLRGAEGRAGQVWALAAWTAFGLATLAKGPHIPALLLAGLSVWMVREGGWRGWRGVVRPLSGALVVGALVTPWVVGVLVRLDGAFAVWGDELFGQRFVDDSGGGLDVGSWLLDVLTLDYVVAMVSLLLPWGLLAPIAFCVPWSPGHRENGAARGLFFALVVTMGALTLVPHSRAYYLLPASPALAVLLARGVLDVSAKAERWRRGRLIGGALVGGVVVSAALTAVVLGDLSSTVDWPAAVFGALVLAAGAGGLRLAWGGGARALTAGVIGACAAWGVAMPWIAGLSARHDSDSGQVWAISRHAAHVTAPGRPVVVIGVNPDDMIYPLGRTAIGLGRHASAGEVLAYAPATLIAPPAWQDELARLGADVEWEGDFPLDEGEWVTVLLIEDAGAAAR